MFAQGSPSGEIVFNADAQGRALCVYAADTAQDTAHATDVSDTPRPSPWLQREGGDKPLSGRSAPRPVMAPSAGRYAQSPGGRGGDYGR
eukprot:3161655-Pleurochrysis_carterae.AAC.1